MRKIIRAFAGLACVGVVSLLSLALFAQASLPDTFLVAQGEDFFVNSNMNITGVPAGPQQDFAQVSSSKSTPIGSYTMNLKLFDTLAVKQVQVQVVQRKMVIPGGTPFGIKMTTNGVIVIGMSDIQMGTQNVNPAKNAGVKIGDILLEIDGKQVKSNAEVSACIAESSGNEVAITLMRNGNEIKLYLQPVKSDYEDKFRAGIWVRDSSAGIGTMTYYDPQTLCFAGLGHAICDVDTGEVMPLYKGEIVDVNITGANPGASGKPGELKGIFTSKQPMGILQINGEYGIFGSLLYPNSTATAIPMALKQEISPGPATILCTLSGNKPGSFEIEIEKVNYSSANTTKNMVIRILDPKLLQTTGGIVQGMSGSPIIQNGKLVGAVTHVFVNDPTRGYAIFAENMDKQMDFVELNNLVS